MAPEAANVGGLVAAEQHDLRRHRARRHRAARQFDVWTAEDNASLGCSDTRAVLARRRPDHGHQLRRRRGRRCPPTDRPGAGDTPTAPTPRCRADRALRARPDRVRRPASAGPRGQRRAVVGGVELAQPDHRPADVRAAVQRLRRRQQRHAGVDVYGSELLTQATTQWAPHFCLDPKLFRFKHVQTGEPRGAATCSAHGNIDGGVRQRAARAGGYARPVVQRAGGASPGSRSPSRSTTPTGTRVHARCG